MGNVNGDIIGLLNRLAKETGATAYSISKALRLNPSTVREWFVGERPIPKKYIFKLASQVSSNEKQHQEFMQTWERRFRFMNKQVERKKSLEKVKKRFTVIIETQPHSTDEEPEALEDLTIIVGVHLKGQEEEATPIYFVTDVAGLHIRKDTEIDGEIYYDLFQEDDIASEEQKFKEKMWVLMDYCDMNQINILGLIELGYQETLSSPFFNPRTYEQSRFVLVPKQQLEHWIKRIKKALDKNAHDLDRRLANNILDIYFKEFSMLSTKVLESQKRILNEFERMFTYILSKDRVSK